jgi:hypothetical protein
MNALGRRVTKLEAGSRDRAAQPCRWCSGVWIYPDQFPHVDGVQPPKPTCERPGACPGGGLLVDLSGDDHEARMCG